MRPSSGLQPATRRWRAFVMPSFGPPCIHEAHFRHRAASVSGFLRPSATVAAWHPGPAAPFRGKASVRLGCISLPPACVATAPRRLRPLVFARLHPRPGNGGDAAGLLPAHRQPAAARTRSRLSLSASGTALSTQAGLLQTNITAMSIGVNRPGCVPCQTGSRLVFYRFPVTAVSSSHRLTAARFRSLPGETRLTKGFCPFPPPIRQ